VPDPSAAPGGPAQELRGAVYVNAFRPLEPSYRSTGLRTHPRRYDALRQAQERAAEEFIVNSRLRRGDVEFETSVASYFVEPTLDAVRLVGREGRRGSRRVPLPEPIAMRLALDETISRRRSVREYTGEAIPLAYLATILRAASGITGSAGDGRLALRATPSGGGLYPIDVHIAATRIDRLAPGTYVYDPLDEALWQTGDHDALESLQRAIAAPDQAVMTSAAAAFVLFVGRPWRGMRKYGPRGMRHLFLEAGAMAEHVNLAATALGVGTVDSSSWYDDEVHEALGLDGVYETLVHGQVLGIPA
jgi:SagB-type dehydrogenase family enzyme